MKMFIGGLFGGIIGAAIWAGIVYATQYEIGWIAIGVGFLVGMGVRSGASEQSDGTIPGVIAVGISIGAIVLAKYMAISFMFSGAMGMDSLAYTNEDMVGQYAAELIEQKEEAGEEIIWPEESEDVDAPLSESYPKEVWDLANAKWDKLSAQEQEAEKKQSEEKTRELIESFSSSMKTMAFKESFGGIDILFFLIAAYTAFNVASGRTEDA